MTEATANEPPRKQSLFDIVQQVLSVLEEVDEAGGEVTAETGSRLDALFGDLDQKAEVYAAVYKLLTEEAEACERYASSYTDRGKAKRARATMLKMRLFDAMQQTGRTKIATRTATIAIQKNSQASIELPEVVPADAPAEYVRVVREWNRDAIKAALAAGKELSFATSTRGSHLRFR